MKRITATLLTLCMALVLLAGCGGTPSPTLTSIGLEPLALTIGEQGTLTPSFTFEGDADEEAKAQAEQALQVAYGSSDETVCTVDASGTVTALAQGESTITCTAGEVRGTTVITVSLLLEGIELNTNVLNLTEGETFQIEATPKPRAAALIQPLTYISSNSPVLAVDDSGLVTGLSVGEATISVTSGTYTEEIVVVVKPMIEGIEFAPSEGILNVGLSYQLAVTATPEMELEYTFTSSDPSVATVSENGTITALKAGTTTITASVVGHEDIIAEYTLTVQASYTPPANTGNGGSIGGRGNSDNGSNGGSTGGGGTGGTTTPPATGGDGGGDPPPAPAPEAPPPAPAPNPGDYVHDGNPADNVHEDGDIYG